MPEPDLLDETEIQPASAWSEWRDDVTPISGRLAQVALVLFGIEALIGLWLRFSAPTLLWLDEALTVNIAKLPFGQLHGALKEDGAPPLYYVVLHLWIMLFGSSDAAVRSLSGLFSCLTVVLVFFLVRRVWGREVAFFATALLLGSSFATYYATETRMYALVMLECALGGWALVWLFERPSWRRMVPLAVVCTALIYTHYWSLYLFITMGLWLVLKAFWSTTDQTRRAARFGLGALVIAGLCFLPWYPTFSFQQAHTGTPWGGRPNYLTAIVAVLHFNANQAVQVARSSLLQRFVELLMVLMMGLALFIIAKGPWRFSLRWATTPRARLVAWLSLGTLVVGVVASHFSGAAYAPRYGSVAFIPLVIFLALGTRALFQPWLRVVVVLVIVGGMLTVGIKEHNTQRSQAGQAVATLEAHANAGSVVLFCPDQLGPSIMRVLPAGTGLKTYGYPRFDDPHFINWVDYNKALYASNPDAGIAKARALAKGHSIWLVTAPGYEVAGDICKALRTTLGEHFASKVWLEGQPKKYYQSMKVTEYFVPPATKASGS